MKCVCGNEMKLIKGGVSKKSGKPYDAFYSCECGETFNPPKEGKVVTSMVSTTPPKPKENGFQPDMRLSYRKDLMVALLNAYGTTADNENLKNLFNDLWQEVEK